jgi:hypothetical protein
VSAVTAKQRLWPAALALAVAGCSTSGDSGKQKAGAAPRRAHGLGLEVSLPAGFSFAERDDALVLTGADGGAVTIRRAPVEPAMGKELCASAANRVELGMVALEPIQLAHGRGVVCSRIERAGPTAGWEARQAPVAIVAVFGNERQLWIARCGPGKGSLQDAESIRPACSEVLSGWRSSQGGGP